MVYAIDVSAAITQTATYPKNFTMVLSWDQHLRQGLRPPGAMCRMDD
jgi:hypothetical protein